MGDDEVAVLRVTGGTQELEALEAGLLVDGAEAVGEPLLEHGPHSLGHFNGVDANDRHAAERRSGQRPRPVAPPATRCPTGLWPIRLTCSPEALPSTDQHKEAADGPLSDGAARRVHAPVGG